METQHISASKFVAVVSDQETLPPKRRRYTTAYKLRFIEQADACTAPGALASLLRREGIYSSTLTDFRRQKAKGDLGNASTPKKPARLSAEDSQLIRDLALSEREVRKLRRDLDQARALLDLQKKVSEIIGFSMDLPEQP